MAGTWWLDNLAATRWARVLAAALAAVCAALLAAGVTQIRRNAATAPARLAPGSQALPLTAQGTVSATVGAAERTYAIHGLEAENPGQRLHARFGPAGVTVTSGGLHATFATTAFGYAHALRALAAATPRATGNRAVYVRPGIRESWVNGPLGLEQSFIIARPPSSAGAGPLELIESLSGDAAAGSTATGIELTAARQSLRYGGLIVTDARGRRLRAGLAPGRKGRIVIWIDSRHAAYPLRIDPFVQQEKLTVTDATGEPSFGITVALSANGSTALIGGSDDGSIASPAGAAWVFTRSDSVWNEQQKITVTDASNSARFGNSVALSADGNTALIGGFGDNNGKGAAWVFMRSGSTWSEQTKLIATGSAANDGVGGAVALSGDGNTALIGAPTQNSSAGAAYVFTRTGSTWSQQTGTLTPSGTAPGLQFGQSVALSADGTTALIGGPVGDQGTAWIFSRSGSTFPTTGTELSGANETGSGTQFGQSVALSGDGSTALVGGPGDNSGAGAVWVFTRSATGWIPGQKLIGSGETGYMNSGDGSFGAAVSLAGDGSTAVIGGPDDDNGAGSVWVFARSGPVFSQQGGKLGAAGEVGNQGMAPASEFGSAVALSSDGNTALMGGPDDGSLGAAWTFIAPPVVSTVGPATGPTTGGTSVTITGNNLGGTTGVTFGSIAARSFTQVSNDQITAVAPPGSAGTVNVIVTTDAAISNPVAGDQFTYQPPVPALTHASESHKTWRASSKLAQISSTRTAPLGTKFSFTLNQAATVKLAFTLDRSGRRRGKKCVAETRKNRHKRKCTRTSSAGTLSLAAPAGADKLAFYGRLSRGARLKPGSYTVAITAGEGGKTSNAVRLSFTIVA